MGTSWRRPAPTVTVYSSAKIAFSAAAMDALGQPAAVCYLVSDGSRVLGFRAAEPGTPDSFRVSPPSNTATARTVLAYLKADLAVTRRYPLTQAGGTWCIDLDAPGELVRHGRRPRGG